MTRLRCRLFCGPPNRPALERLDGPLPPSPTHAHRPGKRALALCSGLTAVSCYRSKRCWNLALLLTGYSCGARSYSSLSRLVPCLQEFHARKANSERETGDCMQSGGQDAISAIRVVYLSCQPNSRNLLAAHLTLRVTPSRFLTPGERHLPPAGPGTDQCQPCAFH
jgi:hypothetical protein